MTDLGATFLLFRGSIHAEVKDSTTLTGRPRKSIGHSNRKLLWNMAWNAVKRDNCKKMNVISRRVNSVFNLSILDSFLVKVMVMRYTEGRLLMTCHSHYVVRWCSFFLIADVVVSDIYASPLSDLDWSSNTLESQNQLQTPRVRDRPKSVVASRPPPPIPAARYPAARCPPSAHYDLLSQAISGEGLIVPLRPSSKHKAPQDDSAPSTERVCSDSRYDSVADSPNPESAADYYNVAG